MLSQIFFKVLYEKSHQLLLNRKYEITILTFRIMKMKIDAYSIPLKNSTKKAINCFFRKALCTECCRVDREYKTPLLT